MDESTRTRWLLALALTEVQERPRPEYVEGAEQLRKDFLRLRVELMISPGNLDQGEERMSRLRVEAEHLLRRLEVAFPKGLPKGFKMGERSDSQDVLTYAEERFPG